eukprot:c24008_g3_i1 orf=562-873(-)
MSSYAALAFNVLSCTGKKMDFFFLRQRVASSRYLFMLVAALLMAVQSGAVWFETLLWLQLHWKGNVGSIFMNGLISSGSTIMASLFNYNLVKAWEVSSRGLQE